MNLNQKGFSGIIFMAIIGGIIGSLFIVGVFVWMEIDKANTINDLNGKLSAIVEVEKQEVDYGGWGLEKKGEKSNKEITPFFEGAELLFVPAEKKVAIEGTGIKLYINERGSINNIPGNPIVLYKDMEIPLLRDTRLLVGNKILQISIPHDCDTKVVFSGDSGENIIESCYFSIVERPLENLPVINQNLSDEVILPILDSPTKYKGSLGNETGEQYIIGDANGNFISLRLIATVSGPYPKNGMILSVVNPFGADSRKIPTSNSNPRNLARDYKILIGPSEILVKVVEDFGIGQNIKLEIESRLIDEVDNSFRVLRYVEAASRPTNQSVTGPDLKGKLPTTPEKLEELYPVTLCSHVDFDDSSNKFAKEYCEGYYCEADSREGCLAIDVIEGYDVTKSGQDGLSDCHWIYNQGELTCKSIYRILP